MKNSCILELERGFSVLFSGGTVRWEYEKFYIYTLQYKLYIYSIYSVQKIDTTYAAAFAKVNSGP